MEKSIRIAVCFSGQLRTGIKASKNLINFFGSLIDKIDFFVHTWDINTLRMPLNLIGNHHEYRVTEKEHLEFQKIYNPVNYYVGNQKEYYSNLIRKYGHTGALVNLWHSAYHANNFKKQHEQYHNFKYDYVVRLRPDVLFPPDRRLLDDINEVDNDKTLYYYINLFGDTYHLSKSNIMDEACNFYLKGGFYGKSFWPMNLFETYMTGIEYPITHFKDNRMTILREPFAYLDPIDFYWHHNSINFFIYENINAASKNVIFSYENINDPAWLNICKDNLIKIFGDKDTVEEYFDVFRDDV